MTRVALETAAAFIYQLAWWVSIPYLRYNHRLAEGYDQRCLARPHLSRADLWIQSASAGEAYLTWEILKRFSGDPPLKILATANTSQGVGILQQAVMSLSGVGSNMEIQTAYFPFDSPVIMKRALRLVRPRLMVLLETELWPGLLSGLKEVACRVLLINGRMTQHSLDRYMIWPSFWRRRRPDKIRAISKQDRDRFVALFGRQGVATMPNIKFDRFTAADPSSASLENITNGLPPQNHFLILGSVREAEEADVEKIIQHILKKQPDTVIGLFPRHMHRLDNWQKTLQRLGIAWSLRSGTQAGNRGVILWDVFGELSLAYPLATAAFVGGSLARLGGQNFLEPLVRGVPTIIGPFWDNFRWVGVEILNQGILQQAKTWKEVADFLVAGIIHPPDREAVKKKALSYIKARQGGADVACRLIGEYLNEGAKVSRVEGG